MLQWLRRFFWVNVEPYMVLNQQKIENKRASLGPAWKYFNDTYALTQVDVSGSVPNFKPASGIPVIVFVNSLTGEMRLFPAVIFQ